MDFEAHITCLGHEEKVKEVGEATGWSFSKIDGDPILGQGVKCYLTHHARDYITLHERMLAVKRELQDKDVNVPVLRTKIELIMHDERYLPKEGARP